MKMHSFELDIDLEHGHSRYSCDISRLDDTTVKVTCDPDYEIEEYNYGWVKYPSIKISASNSDIVLRNSEYIRGKGIKTITVTPPSIIELDSFEAIISLNDKRPINEETLDLYEEDVKKLLTEFIWQPEIRAKFK